MSSLLKSRPIYGIIGHFPKGLSLVASHRSYSNNSQMQSQRNRTWEYTIIAHQPSLTNYKDIVSRAPRLCVKEIHGRTTEESESVPVETQQKEISAVIFTTPSFARWLEDDDFMIQLLNSLSLDKVKGNSVEVDIVSAVVDRLPLPPSQQIETVGKEGFAVMYGPRSLILPDATESNDSPPEAGASIVFDLRPRFSATLVKPKLARFKRNVRIPLAKTMFHNGKDSTLITSTWQMQQSPGSINPTSCSWKKVQQSERVSKTIGLLPNDARIKPYIPAVALTQPCKVISSMGNIVRQIAKNDHDGTVIPASQELEASVSRTFERLNIAPQAVGVWAAIFHLNTNKAKLPERLASKTFTEWKNLRLNGKLGPPTIHRVLSGGGGWGLKEGLVSLDPQSEDDFLSQPSQEDIQSDTTYDLSVSVRTIAEPGSYIQFFIPKHLLPPTQDDQNSQKVTNFAAGASSLETNNSLPLKSSLLLGTTPSSIDNMPNSEGSEEESKKQEKNFDVYLSHFGALSERGIFYTKLLPLASKGNRLHNRTKLDIPYSWLSFARDYALRSDRKSQILSKQGSIKRNMAGGAH